MVKNVLLDDPTPEPLRVTPLDQFHKSLGARMVPFAGYSMPVQYDFPSPIAERCRGGVLAEHLSCRERAGLFDVSHMGQAILSGAGVAEALERLVPGDIVGLKPNRQRYTLLTNEAGGILDDLMVANLGGDRLFIVVNASRKAEDFRHLAIELPDGIKLTEMDDRALLALQGPMAAGVMARLSPDLTALPFMGVASARIGAADCFVSRSGYTGEDGYEISVAAAQADGLARLLLDQPEVVPIGLGARDSLRLEAGLCLYGNDIDELTTPIEADLAWTIGKRRRTEWNFLGALAIRDQLEHGPTRRRVGLRPDGRAPARAGTEIAAEDGTGAGTITSGGFAPSLGAPVAMGYVRKDLAAEGTKIMLLVRGKTLPAQVVKLPFVPHRYVR